MWDLQDTRYLRRDGENSMNGPLILSGDPTGDNEAVRKAYVDTLTGALPTDADIAAAIAIVTDPGGTIDARIAAGGIVALVETTTPVPVPNQGKLYTKNDNNIYFQDGAGVEHTLLKGSTGIQHEFMTPLEDPTGTVGNWDVVQIGTAQNVHFSFQVAEDFEILDNATIVVIPDATETIQWDIFVSVSAPGEAYDNDDRSALNETLAVTANNITELDISGLLTGLSPGDYVAIDFQSDTATIQVVGCEFDFN